MIHSENKRDLKYDDNETERTYWYDDFPNDPIPDPEDLIHDK